MSRRKRKLAVPGAEQGLQSLKANVMKQQGYAVNADRPDDVKFEVARTLGVPLRQGDNGHLTTEEAGSVGGQIGGAMVREMIRMAQERLARDRK